MGNAFSTLERTNHKDEENSLHVFKKETQIISDLLNTILTKDDSFIDPEMNLTENTDCKDYILVLEKSLQKHLKVELKDLNQNILLIPNDEHNSLKKSELCALVTNHFKSILQVILLIKNVFDLEQSGNNSVLGICVQLIKFDANTFTIYYCDSQQGDEKKEEKEKEGKKEKNGKKGKDSEDVL